MKIYIQAVAFAFVIDTMLLFVFQWPQSAHVAFTSALMMAGVYFLKARK